MDFPQERERKWRLEVLSALMGILDWVSVARRKLGVCWRRPADGIMQFIFFKVFFSFV